MTASAWAMLIGIGIFVVLPGAVAYVIPEVVQWCHRRPRG